MWVLDLSCVLPRPLWLSKPASVTWHCEKGCYPSRCSHRGNQLCCSCHGKQAPSPLDPSLLLLQGTWSKKKKRLMKLKRFPLQQEPSSHYGWSWSWQCRRCACILSCSLQTVALLNLLLLLFPPLLSFPALPSLPLLAWAEPRLPYDRRGGIQCCTVCGRRESIKRKKKAGSELWSCALLLFLQRGILPAFPRRRIAENQGASPFQDHRTCCGFKKKSLAIQIFLETL